MEAALLADGRLHTVLRQVDEDLAAELRAGGCPHCGVRLHWARYPRKPRGIPRESAQEYAQRLSLCCARLDCRKRATPASVRFLGPKVYVSAVVVGVGGGTALRAEPMALPSAPGAHWGQPANDHALASAVDADAGRYPVLAGGARRVDAAGGLRRAARCVARTLCW